MALKALVAACFLFILPTRKKSKYYMLLEYISQFYRTLVSTPPWFRYLSNSHNSGAVFAVIITAAYLMIKGGVIFARLRELYRAIINFFQDPVSIGSEGQWLVKLDWTVGEKGVGRYKTQNRMERNWKYIIILEL